MQAMPGGLGQGLGARQAGADAPQLYFYYAGNRSWLQPAGKRRTGQATAARGNLGGIELPNLIERNKGIHET